MVPAWVGPCPCARRPVTIAGQAPAPQAQAAATATADGSSDDLSSQATDPTASPMSFNLINSLPRRTTGSTTAATRFKFQPVVPFRAWGVNNILRVVVPYQIDGPGNEGLEERDDLRPGRPARRNGGDSPSAR